MPTAVKPYTYEPIDEPECKKDGNTNIYLNMMNNSGEKINKCAFVVILSAILLSNYIYEL